ncbi:hypothetical protein AHAS_Ahas04G0098500 [Arachis hypogaea]
MYDGIIKKGPFSCGLNYFFFESTILDKKCPRWRTNESQIYLLNWEFGIEGKNLGNPDLTSRRHHSRKLTSHHRNTAGRVVLFVSTDTVRLQRCHLHCGFLVFIVASPCSAAPFAGSSSP